MTAGTYNGKCQNNCKSEGNCKCKGNCKGKATAKAGQLQKQGNCWWLADDLRPTHRKCAMDGAPGWSGLMRDGGSGLVKRTGMLGKCIKIHLGWNESQFI